MFFENDSESGMFKINVQKKDGEDDQYEERVVTLRKHNAKENG